MSGKCQKIFESNTFYVNDIWARIRIWTTALAIKLLEQKMMEKKDIWEIVANKGECFIKQQCNYNENAATWDPASA